MTDISEADLKTVRQMKAAAQDAVFLTGSTLDAAKALASYSNRSDLRIYPVDVLKTVQMEAIKGIVIKSPIIINHNADLTVEMRENMQKLGVIGILFNQDVPAEQPVYVAPVKEKIVAETITWRLGSTGLTLRDVHGKQLGTLKLSGVAGDNEQSVRANSEALIERVRALISEDNSVTATVMPQHR